MQRERQQRSDVGGNRTTYKILKRTQRLASQPVLCLSLDGASHGLPSPVQARFRTSCRNIARTNSPVHTLNGPISP